MIADVHLGGVDATTQKLLFCWLEPSHFEAKTLIILGDLFEAWIGDDGADDSAIELAQRLRALSDAGVDIIFVEGNRDFLVGKDYCALAGMRRLAEPLILDQVTPPTALIHGDRLCTDDVSYQRFRKTSRKLSWQTRILRLPLFLRRGLARWARWRSHSHQRSLGDSKPMDVNAEAVQAFMHQYKIDRLIHGHTHRPAIHLLKEPNSQRWVLGDWDDGHGYAIILDEDRASLHRLSLGAEHTILWSEPWPPSDH